MDWEGLAAAFLLTVLGFVVQSLASQVSKDLEELQFLGLSFCLAAVGVHFGNVLLVGDRAPDEYLIWVGPLLMSALLLLAWVQRNLLSPSKALHVSGTVAFGIIVLFATFIAWAEV